MLARAPVYMCICECAYMEKNPVGKTKNKMVVAVAEKNAVRNI